MTETTIGSVLKKRGEPDLVVTGVMADAWIVETIGDFSGPLLLTASQAAAYKVSEPEPADEAEIQASMPRDWLRDLDRDKRAEAAANRPETPEETFARLEEEAADGDG